MNVLYYTQPHYLDATLETIQSIKNQVCIHLIIEVAEESKTSNIISLQSLKTPETIISFDTMIPKEEYSFFRYYFKGISSVHFVVHKQKKSISFSSFYISMQLNKFIKSNRIDVIHFDTFSLRSIPLLPFIFNLRKIATIHDSIAHPGEESWKKKLTHKIFYNFIKKYVFYSEYSKQQFIANYNVTNKELIKIRLQPYSFYQQFKSPHLLNDQTILFIGRISYYKGVDIFLNAIPLVLQEHPEQQFVLAGKFDSFHIDSKVTSLYSNNITIVNSYLSSPQVTSEIVKSKFIICPYREASQSGVLMTAKALGKLVIATKVGSFSEYINDGYDGLVIDPDVSILARSINKLIRNNYYKEFEKNVKTEFSENISSLNGHFLLNAYQNI